MKTRDLISELQRLDPESNDEVEIEAGEHDVEIERLWRSGHPNRIGRIIITPQDDLKIAEDSE